MTAMNVLQRCLRAGGDMRRMREKIDRYRNSAARLHPTQTDTPAHGGGEADKMAAIMAEIDELERMIDRREREYQAELVAANQLIDMVPGENARRAAGMYYIDGKNIAGIAQEMRYSYGYVCALRRSAADALADVGPEQVDALLPGWYLDANGGRGENVAE